MNLTKKIKKLFYPLKFDNVIEKFLYINYFPVLILIPIIVIIDQVRF